MSNKDFENQELNQLDLDKLSEDDLKNLSDELIKKILLVEKSKSADLSSHSSDHGSHHGSYPQ